MSDDTTVIYGERRALSRQRGQTFDSLPLRYLYPQRLAN